MKVELGLKLHEIFVNFVAFKVVIELFRSYYLAKSARN